MRFDGKTAVVTGAGRGIGRGVAQRLAAEGAALVVSDVEAANAEETAELIRKDGGTAHARACDVRSEAAVKGLIDETVSLLGGISIMVNNAGIEIVKPVTDLSEEEWDRVLGINLKGTFFGCKHVIPVMVEAGGGSVVNIASAAGLLGWPLLSAYCASKGGVVLFTKSMAQEYRAQGLRFNAVCPMVIETSMGDRFLERYEQDFNIPMTDVINMRQGRLGTVEEVAAAVAFLASDDASFVNGTALALDNAGTSG